MKRKLFLGLMLWCLFSGCARWEDFDDSPEEVEGFRPIYASPEEIRTIKNLAPRLIQQAGKIYVYGKYLFVNELNKGIHIIDNYNPKNPRNIAFIQIPSNVDIAVKNKTLYADNGTDMVVLDISDPLQIQVKNRIKNAFPYKADLPNSGYFECPDPSKGTVVAWERTLLKKPKCRR